MLYLILIALSAGINFLIYKILHKRFIEQKNNYELQKPEYEKLLQENARLKKENLKLEGAAEETIALYDLTKDICKSLDETKIVDILKNQINKGIRVGDCRFIKDKSELLKYRDYTVLPLNIHRDTIGYLVANNIEPKDTEKFLILAHQFLVGIKRAFLYQQVQELSINDSLTNTYSRRHFFEKFNEEIERSKRMKLTFSFLMVDIDHFKYFNDHYGHLVGDAILRDIAVTIKDNIRQIDFIGRYGGEELSIVLTETDMTQAQEAAERIRRAVEAKEIRVYDETLKVTVSIGISTFVNSKEERRALIERADQALYQAKQQGRNRVAFLT